MPIVRPYRAQDQDAVLRICLQTGDNGHDATGLYSDDRLLPAVYADPYLAFEPESAFVVDEGGQVFGYILGVANTANFARWYRDEWIPRCSEYLTPPGDEQSQRLWSIHLHPEGLQRTELAYLPAHLHINLLPQMQGSGMGRALMEAFLMSLEDNGVPGVHLGMSATNENAGRFYRRLGFTPLAIAEPGTAFYGRQLSR